VTSDGSSSWRLAKSQRFRGAAERAFAVDDWDVSRAYYAAYHAAIAALEARAGLSRRRWDHVQLQKEFRERFSKRGFLFDVRHSEGLERMYEVRLMADYERASLNSRQAAYSRQRVSWQT
jgi:uncharacterized protein (UPF0332 family)